MEEIYKTFTYGVIGMAAVLFPILVGIITLPSKVSDFFYGFPVLIKIIICWIWGVVILCLIGISIYSIGVGVQTVLG